MKTLETDRLILRPFRESDAEDLYAYARVEGVGEAAGWTHHKSLDESRAILADFIKKGEVFALALKESGRVIGSLGLHATNNGEKYDPQRELGYVLSRDYWGRGLMSEAAARRFIRLRGHGAEYALVCTLHPQRPLPPRDRKDRLPLSQAVRLRHARRPPSGIAALYPHARAHPTRDSSSSTTFRASSPSPARCCPTTISTCS